MDYACTECGEYFNTPEYEVINEGCFWGAPCSETIEVCPKCFSPKIMSLKRKNITLTPIQSFKEVKK